MRKQTRLMISGLAILFCSAVQANQEAPVQVADYVVDYLGAVCEMPGADYKDVSTIMTEDFYEDGFGGRFYTFSYSYDVYYKGKSIGEAANWGEGAESFGSAEDWSFDLSCPL